MTTVEQKLNKVTIRHSKGTYNAFIGADLDIGELANKVLHPEETDCKAIIVSDSNVSPLYSNKIAQSLEQSGFSVIEYTVPAGEQAKTISSVEDLLSFLAEHKITRTDVLFALGGGVIGDLVGFTASVFLRGIRYVQVPTTLLAAVDSSIGGKTAVDLPAGKNLVGSFYQPSAVFCDVTFFDSLPERDRSSGFAEIIKYGVICDSELFGMLKDKNSDLAELVQRCIYIKALFVEEDEFDNGSRQALNFGHTIGHAVELLSNFDLLHGEAVAVGMYTITKAAEKANIILSPFSDELKEVLKLYNLPYESKFAPDEVVEKALSDKKRKGKTITLVISRKIGTYTLRKIDISEIKALFALGLT